MESTNRALDPFFETILTRGREGMGRKMKKAPLEFQEFKVQPQGCENPIGDESNCRQFRSPTLLWMSRKMNRHCHLLMRRNAICPSSERCFRSNSKSALPSILVWTRKSHVHHFALDNSQSPLVKYHPYFLFLSSGTIRTPTDQPIARYLPHFDPFLRTVTIPPFLQ